MEEYGMEHSNTQSSCPQPGEPYLLTRGEAAKLTGHDISWIRRREGKSLHPKLVDGIYRFMRSEVEALQSQAESEQSIVEASERTRLLVHDAFEQHADGTSQFTLDAIAKCCSLTERQVTQMYKKWGAQEQDEGQPAPRPLLSREKLAAQEALAVQAINREYDARAVEADREYDEFQRRAAAQEVVRDKQARARAAEWEKERACRMARLFPSTPRRTPQATSKAPAGQTAEALRVLLEAATTAWRARG